jgi:hypothetical protein
VAIDDDELERIAGGGVGGVGLEDFERRCPDAEDAVDDTEDDAEFK